MVMEYEVFERDTDGLGQTIASAWVALQSQFSRLSNEPGLAVDAQPFVRLQAVYLHLGLPWHAAYATQQARRMNPALLDPLQPLSALQGRTLGGAIWGESEEAVLTRAEPAWPHLAALAQTLETLALDVCARDWLTWLYLTHLRGVLNTHSREFHKQAVNMALALEPIVGETAHTLGRWRLRAGQPEGAVLAAQGAVKQAPKRFGSWLLQAEALMQLGRVSEAQACFQRAAESPNPQFLSWLAEVLLRYNFADQALAVREQVVKMAPDQTRYWLALALVQSTLWQTAAAEQSLAQALALSPEDPQVRQAIKDLANRAMSRAQFDEELARTKGEGLRANGVGSARLLMQSLYQDHVSAREVADLHRQIGSALVAQLPDGAPPVFTNARASQRRLRVGYVSGDFHRQHPVNVFMLPVLLQHDHSAVEVFIYHTGTMVDEYTQQARQSADHWRLAQALSDKDLQQMMRQDQIDILVDLAGYTASQRLGVFALRAAPVQISYLGYPHSTGLPCMDYMLVDDVVAPPAHEHLFSERLLHLPGSVFCWAPVDHYPLRGGEEPGLTGPVVFGSFNNLLKLSDKTLRLWARVLRAVPESVLLLKAPVLADASVREKTLQRFAQEGIGAERLVLRGPVELSAMMQEYHDIHIALDPTPYNGGTTSLQALWMGVPLVTLLGENFVSRMGASFVQRIGHPEWLAHDENDYVAIATRLAAQRQSAPWSRQALRAQMQASPVCDITGHTREIEAAYRRAWTEYLAGDEGAAHSA
jgi:protein O-GlcNAc transferase